MKHLKVALFVFSVLCVFDLYGQGNLLFQQVQEVKSTGIDFNQIRSMLTEVKEDKDLKRHKDFQEYFKNSNEVSLLQYNKPSLETLAPAITLNVPYKNDEIQLELIETPNSYDYEVVTSDGKRASSNKHIKHYRGIVKNNPNSIVAMTFGENEVLGLIATEEGNFNLIFDKNLGQHIFYNDKNLKDSPQMECGTIDEDVVAYSPEVLRNEFKSSISSSRPRVVRLYFETEYDMFQSLGSVSAVETFVAGIYNQVAVLYLNEDIMTNMSQIFIWTSEDPFTAVTTKDLLTQYQNYRTYSINGDLGQLLTFRNIGGGRAAGFNGLCNNVA